VRGKQKPNDIGFVVWALIILGGLVVMSVALGVTPLSEPAIFDGPSLVFSQLPSMTTQHQINGRPSGRPASNDVVRNILE
jgi:hypothetical protein